MSEPRAHRRIGRAQEKRSSDFDALQYPAQDSRLQRIKVRRDIRKLRHSCILVCNMPSAATQDSLRQRGVRLTRQRRMLLDLIDHSGKHLDAESLFQLAKEKDPR